MCLPKLAETAGRWIAEAPEIPGALAYGVARAAAMVAAEALARRGIPAASPMSIE